MARPDDLVFGDQITQLGLPLVAVLTLGADAGQMGTLTAVGVLPHLLFSLPAGVWLDRVRSRRRLMVIADLGRAGIIASIPIAYALGGLSMLQLYVVGFLAGSLSVVFDLSWNTVFVSVTKRERYIEAMSLLNGSRSLAYVAGPTIGGLLVQVLGAPLAMLADALSFLGSVVFLRRIRAPEPPIEAEAGSIRWRLVSGIAFVLQDPIIRPSMLAVATVNLFTFAFGALFILYVTGTLGVSPGALGLALGIGAVGGLIGAVVASRIGRRIGLGPAYALGCVVFPLSLLTIPLATPDMPMPVILALILASEFGAGLGVMILDINIGSINNARIPDLLRARANGAYRFINYGVRPVGAILGGLLGTAVGVREALFVSALAASPRGALDGRVTGAASQGAAGRRDGGGRGLDQISRGGRRRTPGLLPAEGPDRQADRDDRPDREHRKCPGQVRIARTERDAERVGKRRRRQPRCDGGERIGQVRDRQDDPTEEQERDEQAVREGERGLRAECARHEQAETGECRGPEQQAHDEGHDRRPGSCAPAEDGHGDDDEEHDLRDLDDEDRPHLGRQEPAAGQRRPAEPLEDAVVPFVCGGDPEVDEARGDDG